MTVARIITATDAVLLIAHGTVRDPAHMRAFLREIRRGREPEDALVCEMQDRYRAIGGSPLAEATNRVAAEIANRLGCQAHVGMRFGDPPTIADGVRAAVDGGALRVVVVPLAPFSVHIYAPIARSVAVSHGLEVLAIEPWGTHPALVRGLARDIAAADGARTTIVLSAHSLPAAAIRAGDPYQEQVEACVRAVQTALGRPCKLAFQSAGDSGEWLRPTVEDALEAAKADGDSRVVLSPIGFPNEHVETLYDLDVLAKAHATRLGLDFVRLRTLDERTLAGVLADCIERAGISPNAPDLGDVQ